MKNFMVVDCEAINLYGDTFAVGAVIVDERCNIIDTFSLCCLSRYVKQCLWDEEFWVTGDGKNVLPILEQMPRCNNQEELRSRFYDFYMLHKDSYMILGDCIYPVITKFFMDVVEDDQKERMNKMPYPLEDIASVINIDVDRMEFYNIELNKHLKTSVFGINKQSLTKHHPLDDAIASAYFFLNHPLGGASR